MNRLGTVVVALATVAAIVAPFFLKPYGIYPDLDLGGA